MQLEYNNRGYRIKQSDVKCIRIIYAVPFFICLKIEKKDVWKVTIYTLLDETITANGKEGYLFTDTMAYYKDSGKQGEFVYKDIKGVEVEDEDEDPKTSLYIYTKDGEEYEWRSRLMNKVPVYNFFKDVMAYFKEEKKKQEEKIIKSTVSDDAEKQVSDLLARLTK